MLPSPDSLTRLLADHERRLKDLEGGSRLGNSAINEGALIARDANGVERARFGQLENGLFGVTGSITNEVVYLPTIFKTVDEFGSPPNYAGLAPAVFTVNSTTGRIIVLGTLSIGGSTSLSKGEVTIWVRHVESGNLVGAGNSIVNPGGANTVDGPVIFLVSSDEEGPGTYEVGVRWQFNYFPDSMSFGGILACIPQ